MTDKEKKDYLFAEVCGVLNDYEQECKFDFNEWYEVMKDVWAYLEEEWSKEREV